MGSGSLVLFPTQIKHFSNDLPVGTSIVEQHRTGTDTEQPRVPNAKPGRPHACHAAGGSRGRWKRRVCAPRRCSATADPPGPERRPWQKKRSPKPQTRTNHLNKTRNWASRRAAQPRAHRSSLTDTAPPAPRGLPYAPAGGPPRCTPLYTGIREGSPSMAAAPAAPAPPPFESNPPPNGSAHAQNRPRPRSGRAGAVRAGGLWCAGGARGFALSSLPSAEAPRGWRLLLRVSGWFRSQRPSAGRPRGEGLPRLPLPRPAAWPLETRSSGGLRRGHSAEAWPLGARVLPLPLEAGEIALPHWKGEGGVCLECFPALLDVFQRSFRTG